MTRTRLYLALAVVAGIYGIYALATVDRRPDDEQIRSLIQSAAESIQERSVSGTISLVSRDYRDSNGLNYDRLRLLTAQALHSDTRFSTTADVRQITVDSDRADVKLHAVVRNAGGETIYDREVSLAFSRQPARHMLVVPVKVWRVVSTTNLGLEYGEM